LAAIVAMALFALAGCSYVDAWLSPGKEKEQDTAALPPSSTPGPTLSTPTPSTPTLLDPKQLIGLSQTETEHMLGRPDEVKEGHPATVWRYRTASCMLDLFFYLDLGSRTFRALAYDVSAAGRATDQRAIKACAGRIQSEYRDGKR
jgi:hypothetical protein